MPHKRSFRDEDGRQVVIDQFGRRHTFTPHRYPNLSCAGDSRPEEKVIRDLDGKFRQKDRPELDSPLARKVKADGEKKGWW